jgi:hypothetical protein
LAIFGKMHRIFKGFQLANPKGYNMKRRWDTVVPAYHGGLVPGILHPQGAKIPECSSSLHKMAQYLHRTYAHPPMYFIFCGGRDLTQGLNPTLS